MSEFKGGVNPVFPAAGRGRGGTDILRARPGFLFVILYRQGWWLGPAMAAFGVHAILRRIWSPDPAPWLVSGALVWLVVGVMFRVITWRSRRYVITDRDLIVRAGVLRRVGADVPLYRIQHTTVTQSVLERVFNLGTVGVATAGSDGAVVNLLMVPEPHRVMEALRRAAAGAVASERVIVIGLAGGIGSGKSEVAAALADLGCHVIDSDREAKAALERPEVKARLVEWWGGGVLRPDGSVNRSAIADVVFKREQERARLEGLVHPLVKARRSAFRRAAEEAGARAVVVDAPLLFEAGVDAECDHVIFVDAPREARLARVLKSRGWSQAELERRERAQMPLEEKRRRSSHIVMNSGSAEELRCRTRALLDTLAPG